MRISIGISFPSERFFPIAVSGLVFIRSPIDNFDSVVEQEEQDVGVDLGESKTRHEEGLAIREVETHMEDGHHG